MKKVLLILAFLIVAGAGGFGTYYFWNQNKLQIAQNESLAQQNMMIQNSLNAIGEMTEVYEVNTPTKSGNQIMDNELVAVSVPISSLGETSITDKTDIVGKYYKIDVLPGTIITKDILMDEGMETLKYTFDLPMNSVPVTLKVGDYVDVRALFATGEEYVVVSHKKVINIYDATTVQIKVSEEEQHCLNAALIDYSYCEGMVLRMTKYVNPGLDVDTTAFYPVQTDTEELVRLNKNIVDKSRCVNSSLRAHIDMVIFNMAYDPNADLARSFKNSYNNMDGIIASAQAAWVDEHTDDDGNFVVEEDDLSGNPEGGQNFDAQVGEATENLEQDVGALQDLTGTGTEPAEPAEPPIGG